MNRYWTRIAVGAVLVFGVGLMGVTVVHRGTAQVRGLLATAATRLPLRLAHIGFRLDGRRLGEVTGIDVIRNGPDELGRLTGHVHLSDAEDLDQLRDCTLRLEDSGRRGEAGFLCAEPAELHSGTLVEVGEIVFEPTGLTRPLYLPRHSVAEWRRSEVQQLNASLVRDGSGGVRANGNFDLLDRRHGSQRGSFDLRADSTGAVFSVRDAANHPIVDLRATGGGFTLNIRDRQGRNLLRLLADSVGAALTTHR